MKNKSKEYLRFQEELISNGFLEAKEKRGHFWRETTEKTAFIINLTDGECYVDVLYGFAAIPCVKGEENWFSSFGADMDDCHVRQMLCISEEYGEELARQEVADFYNAYQSLSKDEILLLKKERQKEFLNHFAIVLKPLGFKKKRTKWLKELEGGYVLTFEAQKSAYSDQYYFNVSINLPNVIYPACFHRRVDMFERTLYNWQLLSNEQVENLVKFTMENYITPILKTPLPDLGKTEFVCSSCTCQRNKCKNCWVDHNLWGL